MKKKRVIIVDDDESTRLIERYILETEDSLELFECSNGIESLESIENIKPDLIMIDIEMPKMNGIELCKIIRKNNKFKLLKIILVTGHISDEYIKLGFDTGADDYVKKPFTATELLARVKVQLRLKYEEELNIFKDNLLNNFIMIFSHEIRTPLTGILGFSNFIVTSDATPTIKEYAKIVYDSGKKLQDFFEKVLLLQKLRNTTSIDKQTMTIFNQNIREEFLFRGLNDKIEAKKIKISKKIQINSLNVNYYLMCKAIFHLVENGIDFSEENSEIIIDAKEVGENTEIYIQNERINATLKLHKAFEFLENIVIYNYQEGSLSLPIVKEIIALHDGSIKIEKLASNGIKFILIIPNTKKQYAVNDC